MTIYIHIKKLAFIFKFIFIINLKMDVKNIAICLAPTLLHINNLKDFGNAALNASIANRSSPNGSSKANNNPLTSSSSSASNNSKDPAQIISKQCNASLECLSLMIENPKKIFEVSDEALKKFEYYFQPLTIKGLLHQFDSPNLSAYLNDRFDENIKVILATQQIFVVMIS